MAECRRRPPITKHATRKSMQACVLAKTQDNSINLLITIYYLVTCAVFRPASGACMRSRNAILLLAVQRRLIICTHMLTRTRIVYFTNLLTSGCVGCSPQTGSPPSLCTLVCVYTWCISHSTWGSISNKPNNRRQWGEDWGDVAQGMQLT